MSELWYWPDPDSLNDFPDPLGIEDEWNPWLATMEEGPSVFAEIFSREYIQNSWDSIQAKLDKLKSTERSSYQPRITFSFVELTGDAATNFAKQFGLTEHLARLKYLKTKRPDQFKDNRLGESVLVSGDLSAIKLLVASEHVGDGMSGKWSTKGAIDIPLSRLKLALVQSATGKAGIGTGGSWGQGKKAIAAASKARIVGTYTCHPPAERDDPKVSKRFLGVTYWRQHDSAKRIHRGLGLCGQLTQSDAGGAELWSQFEPFKNQQADSFVADLGLPGFDVRDEDNINDHGTSYFFVDPAFTAQELATAVERNWWPLLASHRVDIEVFDFDGSSLPISPKSRKELWPFITAFDVATGVDSVDESTELAGSLKHGGFDVGRYAIVSDPTPEGWSYEVEPGASNADLVALIRNDMVIAYQHFPRLRPIKPPPYVRGAIVIEKSSKANEMLKMTEGHLHNSWKTDRASVGDADSAALAEVVLNHLNERVKELRKKIKPEVDVKDVRLRPFQTVFKNRGTQVGPSHRAEPKKVARHFVVRDVSRSIVDYSPQIPTELRISASASIALRPGLPEDSMRVRVDLGWAVYEENGPVRDESLTDEMLGGTPAGFRIEGSSLVGVLTKAPVVIAWRSRYFVDDWRVVPDPQVEPLPEAT